MLRHFTLEYWVDEGWYVGRLKKIGLANINKVREAIYEYGGRK